MTDGVEEIGEAEEGAKKGEAQDQGAVKEGVQEGDGLAEVTEVQEKPEGQTQEDESEGQAQLEEAKGQFKENEAESPSQVEEAKNQIQEEKAKGQAQDDMAKGQAQLEEAKGQSQEDNKAQAQEDVKDQLQEGASKEAGSAVSPMRPLALRRSTAIEYTDVVVIGNGPSGITLSYMLAGHWPYYTGASHTDEYLQRRLEDGGDASIIEQDLEYLSSGLEGRSSNPLALLFDNLTHPDADMGEESPSLLRWDYKPEHVVPHVVLGRAAEGGVWQMLEGDVHTLSLGTWMQLPDAPFKQWLSQYRSMKYSAGGRPLTSARKNRASMEEVCQYYMWYVRTKQLSRYFHNQSVVTSVERVLDVCHCVDDDSGEQVPCSRDHSGKFKWEVRGYRTTDTMDTEEFFYRAPNVVLAVGTFDMPNRLCVPGEHNGYVLHSIADLEKKIAQDEFDMQSEPVVIVGAGLSAADAVLYALSQDIPVVHVFRREANDPKIVYRQLPTALYPEYHKVHQMMKQGESQDGRYKAYPSSTVTEFKTDHKVLIHSSDPLTSDVILSVSYAIVLIGSKPNLSFLPGEGRDLGIIPGIKIDCKHNTLAIDPYTQQSIQETGLFAMGPLVGDNFVRFLRGGALGITSHLWRKRHGKL